MNIKRPLVPGFLKTVEQKLLLNKPGIWSARTHLVLYYGILFMLVLAGLCFLEPSDLRQYSTSGYWTGFVCMISIIALTAWLIYLLRFNSFKKYGIIHPLYMLVTFFLYFISTGIIVLFTYVQPVVESVRANISYDDEEIVQDMNAINLKICQLEPHLLQVFWHYDTVAMVKDEELSGTRAYYEDAEISPDTVARRRAYPYVRLDSAEFNRRRADTDSLIKINDTVYIMYKTPNFAFVYAGRADEYTRTTLLSSFEIYSQVRKYPQEGTDKAAIRKELSALIHKYHYQEAFESYNDKVEIRENDGPFEIVHKKYHLYEVEGNISNVVSKKYRWTTANLPEYIRLFYYFTLGITLLIFIFRHSTVRTFFLTLLTALLLTIFTALVFSFSHFDETSAFLWLIAYAVLFFMGSLFAWSGNKRKAITGIMINLFVFILPVIPLLFVGCYYSWKTNQYDKQGKRYELPDIDWYIFYAEIGGALLLLILLATYIQKVYRRWYSLPEH
jgi:hypothetical protein